MYITVSKSIQEYIRKIKSVFESNKVTFILVILCTIGEAGVAAIPYEYYQNIDSFVDMILRVLLYLIIPSLFIETYFAESKVKYVCGYIIAFFFSGMVAACGDLYIFSKMPANIQQIVGSGGIIIKDYAERFMCGILLMLSAAIVYKSF